MSKFLVNLRDEVSRWLMRFNQAGVQLRLVFFGITAAATTGSFMQGTVLQPFIPAVFGLGIAGVVLFTWIYDRFQVLNLQKRHNADRSNNFIGPSHAIQHMIWAEQLAVLGQGMQEDWSQEKILKQMRKTTEESVREYRDGIDMEEIK